MSRTTTTPTAAEAYELARSRGRLGLWEIARTAIGRRYPCRCRLGRGCNPKTCPCAGRRDLDGLPRHCCAPRTAPQPSDITQEAA